MRRPQRPHQRPGGGPPRRRPGGPPGSGGGPGGPPRRRTALDAVPRDPENPFKVLGTGIDRQMVIAAAEPLELVVIQGFTREIEDPFRASRLRPEDFWEQHPELLPTARKLDDILAGIQQRRSG